MTGKDPKHELVGWHQAARHRPALYIGDVGRNGLRYLARSLFECPLEPRRLSVTLRGATLELSAVAVPISVRPRAEGKPIYLVEVASSIMDGIDDPPSLAPIEVLDTQVRPAVFRRVPMAPHGLAYANAFSVEMILSSRRGGVATEVRFSRGVLTAGPVEVATSQEDGVGVSMTPDPEIFGDTCLHFQDLALELRDFALRAGVAVELREPAKDLLFTMPGVTG